MTNIEAKALALVNEAFPLVSITTASFARDRYGAAWDALYRSVEAHEADKADKARHAAELRAENARLREALSHAQGRFLNINIALSSSGTKREAIRIADVGEDCAKNALARAALGEPQ